MTPTTTIDARRYHAVLFDLDGIVTETASVHRGAWKRLFDTYLRDRAGDPTEDHGPFTEEDYVRHVDGRPRLDGVRAFLASRGIEPDEPTVERLGERKDRYFRERLDEDGVEVYRSTVSLVHDLRAAGLRTAVFTSSRNGESVLRRAGLQDLFETRVDGVTAAELGLPGKPDPAVLLEAARRIEAEPVRTVVVEDAHVGVEAGRRGGFGLVIGVDRGGAAQVLREHGADVVVRDLAEVTVAPQRSSTD
ncbi:MAG: HAD-IA family hydrolase [Actinobacteria bacterium]|nr:HAD-IA family hydrolase [Actinomycetota bacterium]